MPTFRITSGVLTLDSTGTNYPDNTLPGGGNIIGGGPIYPSGPVDPGYSPPWAQAPVDPGWSGGLAPGRPPFTGGIWGGGPHPMPPIANVPAVPGGPVDPGYFPPGVVIPAPPVSGQPQKAYLVAYMRNPDGSVERVTFMVDVPKPTVPTQPAPKA